MSEEKENTRDRIRRERQERIDALKEAKAEDAARRAARQEASDDLQTFFGEFSHSRPTSPPQDKPDVQRSSTVVQNESSLPTAEPNKTTPAFKGIPIDFYCWKEGSLAVITLYGKSEPTFL